jgi:lipopolysaccharide transport protein LptA
MLPLKAIIVSAEEQESTTSTPSGGAQEESGKTNEEEEVINGTSDDFEQNEKEGWTIFIGNVKINRTDGFLNADKVTIYTDVETGEALKTIAEGHVELRDGDIFATCDYSVLDHVTDIVELQRNVVVTQNEDQLEADYFKFNRRTGKREGKGNIKFKVRLTPKKALEAEPSSE